MVFLFLLLGFLVVDYLLNLLFPLYLSPLLRLDSEHLALGILFHVLSEDVSELDEVLKELLAVPAWTVDLEAKMYQLEDLVSEYV